MWRFICIATLTIVLSGCCYAEANLSRNTPITINPTMEFDPNDEAFFRGCIAGIASAHMRAKTSQMFNWEYSRDLCEEVRRNLSCLHLGICDKNHRANKI
jgi:hypothetical protein